MQINDIIALKKDQYQLIEKQVGGAQAYVFKVRRVSDQQTLALKIARIWKKPDVLWPISRVNANCGRIQQEIDFLQALEKPEKHYIVACLDSATLQQGGKEVPAFVMPFYDQPLSKALLDDEQPTLARHLTWIQQMIVALKYIHHHRKDGEALLHRDLKLDNLMLTNKDDIRLLDFGISKQVFRRDDSTHTKMNYSDDCVAPEQILIIKPNTDGKKHVAIGTHTDIYALGLLMYRLIAGHLPESHEQFIMNLDELSQQHREALNNGEEGLLGKVGGITEDETEFLMQSFVDLAEGIPVTFTYDDEEFDDEDSTTDSPYQALAERFAEFVAELLDKRYQDRPNAKSALHWVENVQFKLNALDQKVAKEKKDKEKRATASSKPPRRPKPNPTTPVRPAVQMTDSVTDQTVIMPTPVHQPTPQPHKEPPPSPPKKPLRTSVLSGAEKKNKPSGEKDIPMIPANWPVKKILIAVIAISLAINAWLFLRPKADTDLPPDDTSTPTYDNTNSPSYQSSATDNKNDSNSQNNQSTPNKASLGNDNKKWAKVIPKLKRLAQQGNAEASSLMAHAYQYGKGGDADWGKAWRYYQQALQQGGDSKLEQQRQELEVKANRILTDTSSPIEQRQKAYQVIETVANKNLIPLSINARLWMEYRYRTGDGVTVNHNRADEWNKKYNAIKDKTP